MNKDDAANRKAGYVNYSGTAEAVTNGSTPADANVGNYPASGDSWKQRKNNSAATSKALGKSDPLRDLK